MATNITTLKQKLAGTSAGDYGGMATVDQAFDFDKEFTKAADDSLAADTTADTRAWTNPYDFSVELVSALYTAAGTITAHDTNYAQLKIGVDDGAAGAVGNALIWETKITGGTGNVAAKVAKTNTGRTAANCTVAPGASVYFSIAKQGSGVIVRAGAITLRLRRK